MGMYTACVRETLSACNGYESKEVHGLFMVSFETAAAAVEWAVTLQLAMMKVRYHDTDIC